MADPSNINPDELEKRLLEHERRIRQAWKAILFLQGKIPGADGMQRHGSVYSVPTGSGYRYKSFVRLGLHGSGHAAPTYRYHSRPKIGLRATSVPVGPPHYLYHSGPKKGLRSTSVVTVPPKYVYNGIITKGIAVVPTYWYSSPVVSVSSKGLSAISLVVYVSPGHYTYASVSSKGLSASSSVAYVPPPSYAYASIVAKGLGSSSVTVYIP